jgi:hypothetical protein
MDRIGSLARVLSAAVPPIGLLLVACSNGGDGERT